MMNHLFLGLSVAAMSTPQDFPVPVQQTTFQKTLLANISLHAATASTQAKPQLLELFGSGEVKGILKSCCPTYAQLPAEKLLELFDALVSTAELTHNINSNTSENKEWNDLSLDELYKDNLPAMYNLWALGYLNLSHFGQGEKGSGQFENIAETKLMNFPNFTGKFAGGLNLPANVEEALSRPYYTTLNIFGMGTAANMFGDVAFVINDLYRDLSLFAPSDTGAWVAACILKYPPAKPPHFFPPAFDCSKWAPTLVGSNDDKYHILLANIRLWESASPGFLERFISRAFGPGSIADGVRSTTPVKASDILSFIEVDPVANVLMPGGVKFVVAAYSTLFGTSKGHQLQSWASKSGVVLLWGDSFEESDPMGSQLVSGRLVDPLVLMHTTASRNASLPSDYTTLFNKAWASPTSFDDLFNMSPASAKVRPVAPWHCSEPSKCIGSDMNQHCICY
eukprot:m.305121 g.305121  ORF g.305121 m.305121 type:complete len:452 (-) comp16446_c4_seq26:920-2275(-)